MSRPPINSRPYQGNIGKLRELLRKSENRVCADCGAPDPKWASANIGVFICLKCCGVHRSLGSHISKVLSVSLDEWSDDEIDSMVEVGGNSSANKIYEGFIPEGYSKPGPDSSHEERKKFIRSKYEFQEFLKPSLRIVSLPGRSSLQTSLSRKIMDSFRSSNSSTKMEGMVEFIGMLKIRVIKGTNLAIRDLLSSDPYVILSLGQQEINDLPSNPNQPPSNPQLAPRAKPWEVSQAQNNSSYVLQSHANGEGSSFKEQDSRPASQLNGYSSEPWWQRKSVRISELESKDEPMTTSNDAVGVTNQQVPQRVWVPPQPPPVAMPEAAAAVRQPKPITPKKQTSNDRIRARPSEDFDNLQRFTEVSELGGQLEINNESPSLESNGIQEQQELSAEGN